MNFNSVTINNKVVFPAKEIFYFTSCRQPWMRRLIEGIDYVYNNTSRGRQCFITKKGIKNLIHNLANGDVRHKEAAIELSSILSKIEEQNKEETKKQQWLRRKFDDLEIENKKLQKENKKLIEENKKLRNTIFGKQNFPNVI
jgi:hypothetical protein